MLGTSVHSSKWAACSFPPLPLATCCRRGRRPCSSAVPLPRQTVHAFRLRRGEVLGSRSAGATSLPGRRCGGDGVSLGLRRGPRPPLPCPRQPWAFAGARARAPCASRASRTGGGCAHAVSRMLEGRTWNASPALRRSDGRRGGRAGVSISGQCPDGRVLTSESGILLRAVPGTVPRLAGAHGTPGEQKPRALPGPRLPPGSGAPRRQSGKSPDAHAELWLGMGEAAAIPLG